LNFVVAVAWFIFFAITYLKSIMPKYISKFKSISKFLYLLILYHDWLRNDLYCKVVSCLFYYIRLASSDEYLSPTAAQFDNSDEYFYSNEKRTD
jgi:hypothetical protein